MLMAPSSKLWTSPHAILWWVTQRTEETSRKQFSQEFSKINNSSFLTNEICTHVFTRPWAEKRRQAPNKLTIRNQRCKTAQKGLRGHWNAKYYKQGLISHHFLEIPHWPVNMCKTTFQQWRERKGTRSRGKQFYYPLLNCCPQFPKRCCLLETTRTVRKRMHYTGLTHDCIPCIPGKKNHN